MGGYFIIRMFIHNRIGSSSSIPLIELTVDVLNVRKDPLRRLLTHPLSQ